MKKLLTLAILLALPLLALAAYFWKFYSKEETINTEAGRRGYRIHVPLKLEGKVPLVIFLHGYGDNSRLAELYTGWSAWADRKKFIVVYPFGSNSIFDPALSWNAGSCCGAALKNGTDDVKFINLLADNVVSKYPVDPTRVYLAGFSNGGMLVHRLLAESPEKFRAGGVVGAAVGGRPDSSATFYRLPGAKKPASIIMFHGDRDWAVPYDGGRSRVVEAFPVPEFTSFGDAVEYWSRTGLCEANPDTVQGKHHVRFKYLKCADNARVEAWTIKGRGHEWTGGILEFVIYGASGRVETTEEMWRFFTEVSG